MVSVPGLKGLIQLAPRLRRFADMIHFAVLPYNLYLLLSAWLRWHLFVIYLDDLRRPHEKICHIIIITQLQIRFVRSLRERSNVYFDEIAFEYGKGTLRKWLSHNKKVYIGRGGGDQGTHDRYSGIRPTYTLKRIYKLYGDHYVIPWAVMF